MTIDRTGKERKPAQPIPLLLRASLKEGMDAISVNFLLFRTTILSSVTLGWCEV